MARLVLELSYGGVRIRVLRGDITAWASDIRPSAIVNPANSLMLMGGGVAGAIRRAGGAEIEEEARRHAPVPVGQAIATGAGRLAVDYVIHAPTMEQPAMRTTSEKVLLATRAALRCAEEKGIRAIAFPGMGTGVGGLSPGEAAEVMMKALKEHIDAGTSLEVVDFVAFTADLEEAFSKWARELFSGASS
ncbi:MAG TPA: macro domain-containing protein [Candidatus Bathyarchaeota archaeon]|nr:macro domain-containing protein [Candidatus Bathyarchaeota archaeon]